MDGSHTHGHGPTGLGELVVLALGVVVAAGILARVLTLLLVVLAVGGGLLLIGFIGYVVLACRRYQQQDTWLNTTPRGWPDVPGDPPRAVNDDPVPLRQAITELQAQLLAARAGLPAVDRSEHQHLHFHGLTPEQAAAIIAELQARHHPGGWQDGGSQ
jgi:predicted membrane channel-forming protein YqfA (hemolysin III family)